MSSYIHPYYYCDGEFVDNSFIPNSAEDTGVVVYEVLRLMMGKPLFIEDHLERLELSIKALGYSFNMTKEELLKAVSELCLKNDCEVGNVEIKIQVYNSTNYKISTGFIPHSYPNPTSYIFGVKACTIEANRDNPNVKVKGTRARQLADVKLSGSVFHEALLVNEQGLITEGSRSNVFFIIKDKIVTSSSNKVLEGITRKYVIKAIEKLGLPCIFDSINVEQLPDIQSAFLCGTSPGVLPISQVNEYVLDVENPTLRKVMQGFNDELKNYLS